MKKDKATCPFEEALKKHLDEVAEKDATFRLAYEKPNKSLKECANYIIGEARKQANKGVFVLSDEETYGMAIHYYDEDDIKVEAKDAVDVKVATSIEPQPKKAKRGRKSKAEKTVEQPETTPVVEEAGEWELNIPLF